MKLEELIKIAKALPKSTSIYLHDHPDNGGSKLSGVWTRGQMLILKDGQERIGDPELEKDDIFIGINSCVRCGHNHEMLLFKRLRNPISIPNSNRLMTHWSICPFIGQPILFEALKTEN